MSVRPYVRPSVPSSVSRKRQFQPVNHCVHILIHYERILLPARACYLFLVALRLSSMLAVTKYIFLFFSLLFFHASFTGILQVRSVENEWMNDEWINEWMTNESMTEWINEWVTECINLYMNRGVNKRIDVWMNDPMNGIIELRNRWIKSCKWPTLITLCHSPAANH